MSVTIDDLAIYLRQFFAEKLPVGGAGGAGTVVLVFDGLGRPMPLVSSSVPARLKFETCWHQRAAQLADQLPAANALTSGSYLARASSRLSRLYESILVSGSPYHDEATLHSFDAGKSRHWRHSRITKCSSSRARLRAEPVAPRPPRPRTTTTTPPACHLPIGTCLTANIGRPTSWMRVPPLHKPVAHPT